MAVAALLLTYVPLFSSVAAVPDSAETRSERWREARREKAEDLEPLEHGWFEGLLARAESESASEGPALGFRGLQPVLGGLRNGAGATAGLLFEPWKHGEPLYFSLAGRASLRGYWGVESFFGHDVRPAVLYAYGRYHHLPQEDFYGIGPNTPQSDRTSYRLDELLFGGLAGYSPVHSLFFGAHFSFLENRIGPGTEDDVPDVDDVFTEREAPGMHPGVSYLVGGAWAEYDTREIPPLRAYGSRYSPAQRRLQGLSLDAQKGLHASAEFSHYTDLDGGDYGFSRLTLEAQEYIPIRGGFQVIALRQYGSFSLPESGDVVPFYMMRSIGGVRSVRGFDNFRFRELNVLLTNTEFRWRAWHALQLAVFVDAGHVFRRVEDVSMHDVEASYGAGARFQFRGRMFLRVEVARSREGTSTYVKIGSFL